MKIAIDRSSKAALYQDKSMTNAVQANLAAKAEVNAAEAGVETARAQLVQAKAQVNIAKAAVAATKGQLENAKAEVNTAIFNLGLTRIVRSYRWCRRHCTSTNWQPRESNERTANRC